MSDVTIILGLLAAVAALVLLAEHLGIAYPILLVIGGLILGFIPAVPDVTFQPDLVFLIFLPPLLYWDALTTSWREFRTNLRAITSLATGLVVVTTCGVAVVAHAVLNLPWAVAFVLGAIVSSTDAVAAGSIASRLGVPQHIVIILEGEGLVNDATALVVYGSAVAAVVQGTFSLPGAGIQFVAASVGGVAVGLAVGWVLIHLRRLITDGRVESTVALLTPFVAYIPATLLGVSGVLATVATGLYVARISPVVISPATRLRANTIWEVGTFLINGVIFILIGLEFQSILRGLEHRPVATLLQDIAVVCITVIGMRILWVFTQAYVARVLSHVRRHNAVRSTGGELTIMAWAGMRGVIALATALALPERTRNGPFPDRDLILFLTFGVIVVTLVGQGLTLPLLIRRLNVREDDQTVREETQARFTIAQAALAQLDVWERRGDAPQELIEGLRTYYERRAARFGSDWQEADDHRIAVVHELRRALLDAERSALVNLRDRHVIGDDVLRMIERDLDLEDVRLDALAR